MTLRKARFEPVAITGSASWTSFGFGNDALVAGLLSGTSSAGDLTDIPLNDPWARCRSGMRIATEGRERGLTARDFALDQDLADELGKRTARDALRDSAVPLKDHDPRRVGVFVGNCHGSNHGVIEQVYRAANDLRPRHGALYKMAAWTARTIAQEHGIRGPAITINTACSSGLNAIGQAANLIAAGILSCAVAGGHDLFSYLSFAGFNSLKALARTACQPFDQNRDGMSLGDGAAYVVLEAQASALGRAARILGYVTGYSCRTEGYHLTAPNPSGDGALTVMTEALSTDPRPADLGLVSAHGTGTDANDAAELAALLRLLERVNLDALPLPVFSIKSQIGHAMGGAGAIQVAAALECISNALLPATAGLTTPMSDDTRLLFPSHPSRMTSPAKLILVNSFAFGGNVASLALRGPTIPRWET